MRVALKMTPYSGIFEGISWSVSRLPCLLEVGARLAEGGGGTGRVLARFRSRIEAAAPAPWGLVVRDAGPDGDGADMNVAEIDQPAFFASVVVAAAGEFGHAAIEARAGRRRQAATGLMVGGDGIEPPTRCV